MGLLPFLAQTSLSNVPFKTQLGKRINLFYRTVRRLAASCLAVCVSATSLEYARLPAGRKGFSGKTTVAPAENLEVIDSARFFLWGEA